MKFTSKITLLITSILSLVSCGEKKVYPSKDYVLTLDYKENFKILQLTDLHLGDIDDLQTHFDFMDLTINEAKPDLIIITGDVFTFSSKKTALKVFDYIESHNIPWTLCFGNHDEQAFYSIEWLTNVLNNYGKHCYFKDIQDDNLVGNSTFAINLNQGNKTHTQLIIMDSNRYYFGEQFAYDFVKPEQIDWYKRLINDTTEQNGDIVPSLYFAHIPLPEIDDAFAKGSDLNGEKRENTCPPNYNSGFFDVIKSLGSTKALFFGHDHKNNFNCTYEGVLFSYGVKSTDRVYFDEDMLGGQLITIDEDNKLTLKPIIHTYNEVKK